MKLSSLEQLPGSPIFIRAKQSSFVGVFVSSTTFVLLFFIHFFQNEPIIGVLAFQAAWNLFWSKYLQLWSINIHLFSICANLFFSLRRNYEAKTIVEGVIYTLLISSSLIVALVFFAMVIFDFSLLLFSGPILP